MSDGTSRLLQAEEQFRQSAHFFPAVPRPRLKSDQACSTFVKPRQLKTKVRCSQTTDLKEKCKLILFMRFRNAFFEFWKRVRFDDVIVKDRLIAASIKKLILKVTKKSTDDEGPISRRVLAVE